MNGKLKQYKDVLKRTNSGQKLVEPQRRATGTLSFSPNTMVLPTDHVQQPVVLVVEDQPPAREFILFLLKRLNLNTIVAETGEKAQEILQHQPVDCILMDISLGAGMSGLALMKILRQETIFQETPIIAVTTYQKKDLGNGAINGFTDYLQKPYLFQDLKNILKKHSITN